MTLKFTLQSLSQCGVRTRYIETTFKNYNKYFRYFIQYLVNFSFIKVTLNSIVILYLSLTTVEAELKKGKNKPNHNIFNNTKI